MNKSNQDSFEPTQADIDQLIEEQVSPFTDISTGGETPQPYSQEGYSPANQQHFNQETPEQKQVEVVSLEEHKRLYADFLNYRRRSQSEINESLILGEKRVLEDLLPLFDFMEMFISNNDPSDNNFKYVFSQLNTLKTKYNLESYGEVGQVFNPSIHDALESGDSNDKSITKVFSRGYTYKDKVIRIAVVGVN